MVQTATSSTGLTYGGDEAFLDVLQQSGTALTQTLVDTNLKELLLITGKEDSLLEYPVEIEVVRTEATALRSALPIGLRVFGVTSAVGMPRLDSIQSTGRGDEYDQTVLSTMQSIFGQINFPRRHLQVGDTFSEVIPLSIPILTMSLDMVITSEYELIAIKDGLAYFDIDQRYTLTSGGDERFEADASGSGVGSLVYSLEHEFITQQSSDTEMTMEMSFDQFTMKMDQRMDFEQNVKIESTQ